ncbi:MAG: prepilin-type N-terminal cleavage/methylation domain-containing protein [Burkholderiaceae bacterium]
MSRGARRLTRGFTLLELLVAVALLSILAVLSWRGMDSVLQGRDRIVGASNQLRGLTMAMVQIEEDLRRAWPIRLMGLAEPPISFLPGTDREPTSLSLLREASGADAIQVQRVVYRVRDGVLERGFSLWAAPSPDNSQQVPATPFTWQPLLAGVQGVEFRGWLADRGWQPAAALSPAQLTGSASAPPAEGGSAAAAPTISGVELVLLQNGLRYLRVFAVGN